MWNKAEENTEALRSAFEAAAERAAEEAELATAEALARADREYRGATPASLASLACLYCLTCRASVASLAFLGLRIGTERVGDLYMLCVFFTFNRSFEPLTSSTPSVRADSPS